MTRRWMGVTGESYYGPSPHMAALLEIWPKIPLNSKILELGCGVGRQTYRLQELGYTNLTRVDVNPDVLKDLHFFHISTPLEVDLERENWGVLEGTKWDLIFTVAVLEHLFHPYAMDKMAKMAQKWIAVCEDEMNTLDTHTARNYKKEFEKRGWVQVDERIVPEDTSFVARVFKPCR